MCPGPMGFLLTVQCTLGQNPGECAPPAAAAISPEDPALFVWKVKVFSASWLCCFYNESRCHSFSSTNDLEEGQQRAGWVQGRPAPPPQFYCQAATHLHLHTVLCCPPAETAELSIQDPQSLKHLLLGPLRKCR